MEKRFHITTQSHSRHLDKNGPPLQIILFIVNQITLYCPRYNHWKLVKKHPKHQKLQKHTPTIHKKCFFYPQLIPHQLTNIL